MDTDFITNEKFISKLDKKHCSQEVKEIWVTRFDKCLENMKSYCKDLYAWLYAVGLSSSYHLLLHEMKQLYLQKLKSCEDKALEIIDKGENLKKKRFKTLTSTGASSAKRRRITAKSHLQETPKSSSLVSMETPTSFTEHYGSYEPLSGMIYGASGPIIADYSTPTGEQAPSSVIREDVWLTSPLQVQPLIESQQHSTINNQMESFKDHEPSEDAEANQFSGLLDFYWKRDYFGVVSKATSSQQLEQFPNETAFDQEEQEPSGLGNFPEEAPKTSHEPASYQGSRK